MGKKAKAKPMNCRDLSKKADIPYALAKRLLLRGVIKGERKGNRTWRVNPQSYSAYLLNNRKKMEKLSQEYIDLYRGGMTVRCLQQRANKDFLKMGIYFPVRGFAEKVIYEYLKKG